MRHNCIRDLEAELMRGVWKDVKIDRARIVTIGQQYDAEREYQEKARLDVSGNGL